MLRKFVRDSSLYSFVTLCEKGVTFLLFPLLAGSLTADDLGVFDALLAAAAVAAIFAGAELYQALARFAPEADDRERGALAGTALVAGLSGCLVLATLMLAARAFGLTLFRPVGFAGNAALWLSVLTMANVLGSLMINLLRAETASRTLAAVSAVRLGTYAAVSLEFVLRRGMGLQGLLIGHVTAAGTALALMVWLRRRILKLTWDAPRLLKLIKFSAPLLVGSLAAVLTQYGDRFVVSGMLGVGDTGLLGTANRITGALLILMGGFSGALTPLIYKHHADSAAPATVGFLFRMYLFVFPLCGLLITIAGRLYLDECFRAEYQAAAVLLPLQVAAMMASCAYLFFPGLSIALKTVAILRIQLLALFLTLAFMAIGIRIFGLPGSSLAVIAGQLISSALYARCGREHFCFSVPWLRCGVFIASTTAAAIAIFRFRPDQWVASLFIVLCVLVFGLLIRVVEVGHLLVRFQRYLRR